MTDLRSELIGAPPEPIPRFRMLGPAGWVMKSLTGDDAAAMFSVDRLPGAASAPRQHIEEYRRMADSAFQSLKDSGAFAVLTPGDESPEWASMPVSVLCIEHASTPTRPLDALVARLVNHAGAEPMDEAGRFLRWDSTSLKELGDGRARARTINHLVAVPGTQRQRALQFTSTISSPESMPEDDDALIAWEAMIDSMVTSLQWEVGRA